VKKLIGLPAKQDSVKKLHTVFIMVCDKVKWRAVFQTAISSHLYWFVHV
jgi:hypothetical protein